MGYIRGFIHGAAAGTVAGLCIAPQRGDKTRAQLQTLALNVQRTVRVVQRTARRVAPQVQDAARSAVDAANKVTGHDDDGRGTYPTASATHHRVSKN